MNEKRYNFEAFLDKIKGEDCSMIISLTTLELYSAESDVKNVKSLVERKYHIGNSYVKQLREFLFYMNSGKKPGTVDKGDFDLYKMVVILLVEKNIYKKSALGIFDTVDAREE